MSLSGQISSSQDRSRQGLVRSDEIKSGQDMFRQVVDSSIQVIVRSGQVKVRSMSCQVK